jgi:hypothetical protein
MLSPPVAFQLRIRFAAVPESSEHSIADVMPSHFGSSEENPLQSQTFMQRIVSESVTQQ